MSPITTHILDTARGQPAAGVPVRLARRSADGSFTELGSGVTDAEGRLRTLFEEGPLTIDTYRITFDVAGYFAGLGTTAFYPEVVVTFTVRRADEHYHVPLLLNPFGYSTYRGS